MSTVTAIGERESKIRTILDDLILERRRLAATAPEAGLRDANRLAIVYWEWQLERCRAEARCERRAGGPPPGR